VDGGVHKALGDEEIVKKIKTQIEDGEIAGPALGNGDGPAPEQMVAAQRQRRTAQRQRKKIELAGARQRGKPITSSTKSEP